MLPLFVETYENSANGATCPVLLDIPGLLFEKAPKGVMRDF